MKIFALLAAALLAGCAYNHDSACTEHQLVPITAGGQVYFVPGRCTGWVFGPTREQAKRMEQHRLLTGNRP